MINPTIEILIILGLLLTNGVFAMAEIAIISARKARLKQSADSGSAQAQVALELANSPNQFLATVQIGITLVGIMAGAFGGATIAQEIAAVLAEIPSLAPYSETIAIVIVVVTITYFSLVVGELVPKRLALNNPEQAAIRLAVPMRSLSRLARPIVRLLSFSTDIIIRAMGVKPTEQPPVTPEEIRVLIELGKQSGEFEATEQNMIDGVLDLDDRRIGAFMTPRTQIVSLDIEDDPSEIQRKIQVSPRSSFPVVKDDLDHVLGIVDAMDLLNQILADGHLNLSALIRPPLFVPETMSALQVLDQLKQEGVRSALITDEYGGVEGMVTHGIILEDISGYLPSGTAPIEPVSIPLSDGAQLLDGMLPIEEVQEIFKIQELPKGEKGLYQTLGGFVMARIRSIPTEGQTFAWEELCFEVIRMDGLRVGLVRVTPLDADDPQIPCS